jgi:hypothetical protein
MARGDKLETATKRAREQLANLKKIRHRPDGEQKQPQPMRDTDLRRWLDSKELQPPK